MATKFIDVKLKKRRRIERKLCERAVYSLLYFPCDRPRELKQRRRRRQRERHKTKSNKQQQSLRKSVRHFGNFIFRLLQNNNVKWPNSRFCGERDDMAENFSWLS